MRSSEAVWSEKVADFSIRISRLKPWSPTIHERFPSHALARWTSCTWRFEAGGNTFLWVQSGRPAGRPLTCISRDATAPSLVNGFQRNWAQLFITWVNTAENGFQGHGIKGQGHMYTSVRTG